MDLLYMHYAIRRGMEICSFSVMAWWQSIEDLYQNLPEPLSSFFTRSLYGQYLWWTVWGWVFPYQMRSFSSLSMSSSDKRNGCLKCTLLRVELNRVHDVLVPHHIKDYLKESTNPIIWRYILELQPEKYSAYGAWYYNEYLNSLNSGSLWLIKRTWHWQILSHFLFIAFTIQMKQYMYIHVYVYNVKMKYTTFKYE